MSLTLQRRGLVDEYNGYQFRRESMAQDSAGKLIYPHNARFESGPFGSDKAILVEEGTENLLSDKLSPNTWVKGSEVDIVESAGLAPDGTLSAYKVIFNGTILIGNRIYINSIGSANHKCFSVWMRADVPQNVVVVFSDQYSDENGKREIISLTQEWQRFSIVETDKLRPIRLQIQRGAGSEAQEFYFWNPQLEQKPYATTFTPSVRADESLTVPIEGLLSPEQGTIELWYNDNGINKNKIVVKCGDLKFNPVSVTEGWHLISVIWDGVDTNYYIDKELVSTTNSPTELGSLYLGSDGDIDFINSLISHLRLSSIARTQEQLAPLDAPPTVDEYTTLYLPFNGPDNVRATTVVTL